MPSMSVLGALSGSVVSPALAYALYLMGLARDTEKHGHRPTPTENKAILGVVAAGNAAVIVGALIMASACRGALGVLEVLCALLVPVPYAVFRSITPCAQPLPLPLPPPAEDYPRF